MSTLEQPADDGGHVPPMLQPAFSTDCMVAGIVVAVLKTEVWAAESTGCKPITYFVFEVRKGPAVFSIRRRYKDFDQLYSKLCETYGRQAVPQMPPKQLLKNENELFLKKRGQQLLHFLIELLEDEVLSLSPELCSFLECAAGSQLASVNAGIATCASILQGELIYEEQERLNAERQLDEIRRTLQTELRVEQMRRFEVEKRLAELQSNLQSELGYRLGVESRLAEATSRLVDVRERYAARTSTLKAELHAEEHTRCTVEERLVETAVTLQNTRADACRARLEVSIAMHAAFTARKQVLAMLWRVRSKRLKQHALGIWSRNVKAAANGDLLADIEGVAPSTASPSRTLCSSDCQSCGDLKQSGTTFNRQDEVAPTALAPYTPIKELRGEIVASEMIVKSGLLLKQGASLGPLGNRTFKERHFELLQVQSKPGGPLTHFLVYYNTEDKALKGSIPLEGATLSIECDAEGHNVLLLSTPARRLSFLTPGFALGTWGASPPIPLAAEANMSLLQRVDAWSKNACRNVMASGPIHAPVTTWRFVAKSRSDFDEWHEALAACKGVESPAKLHTQYRSVARNIGGPPTPIVFGPKEVM